MRTVRLHLARLRRHYEVSVRQHDEIALLDLSHALRIWAELKTVLPTIAPKFKSTLSFKTAIPAKKVMKAARGHRFVFAYMPGGVKTYASNRMLIAGSNPDDTKDKFTMGASIKQNSDGSAELSNYCFIDTSLDESLIEKLRVQDQTRCNYVQWLGAEAVRLSYVASNGDLVVTAISREMLIKRVAKTLDGSHPSAASTQNEADTEGNEYDPAVRQLLSYHMGGLKLPYFLLLKIAQDILEIAPKLLDQGDSEGAT